LAFSFNDTPCKNFHCQVCLLPLKAVNGVNMHPSAPGWRGCEFRYRDQLRKTLLIASHGLPIDMELPSDFPLTGPEAAMAWALSANPGNAPNIVLFAAAMLGI
jgi:hypothetical protein